jgi:hypothetical protein
VVGPAVIGALTGVVPSLFNVSVPALLPPHAVVKNTKPTIMQKFVFIARESRTAAMGFAS